MSVSKQNYIKQLKQLVKDEPETYDSNKLQGAIDIVNKATDIDALIILGDAQTYLVKDNLYDWSKSELDKVKDCITSCGLKVKEVKQLEPEQARDDYAFVTDHEDYNVIWVSKMQPLFENEGVYKLLGIGFDFPSEDFDTLEELIENLKSRLK